MKIDLDLPLAVQCEGIRALSVFNRQPHVFTNDEIDLVNLFGTQDGSTIRHSRLPVENNRISTKPMPAVGAMQIETARMQLDQIEDRLREIFLELYRAFPEDLGSEPVDLGDIVRDVSAALQSLAAEGNLNLETDLDPSLIDVVTDPRSLKAGAL